MAKKRKTVRGIDFLGFLKQLGYVVVPIGGVAAIANYTFNNPEYTKIAVFITIIALYIIRLEIKLRRLENGYN